jgi:hypothetical protein
MYPRPGRKNAPCPGTDKKCKQINVPLSYENMVIETFTKLFVFGNNKNAKEKVFCIASVLYTTTLAIVV